MSLALFINEDHLVSFCHTDQARLIDVPAPFIVGQFYLWYIVKVKCGHLSLSFYIDADPRPICNFR